MDSSWNDVEFSDAFIKKFDNEKEVKSMESRVVQQAIRKLTDLFPNESGRVGAKSALAMGAVIGAAAIAQMMFASSAQAHVGCIATDQCSPSQQFPQCCCKYAGGVHLHCTWVAYCVNPLGGQCI